MRVSIVREQTHLQVVVENPSCAYRFLGKQYPLGARVEEWAEADRRARRDAAGWVEAFERAGIPVQLDLGLAVEQEERS